MRISRPQNSYTSVRHIDVLVAKIRDNACGHSAGGLQKYVDAERVGSLVSWPNWAAKHHHVLARPESALQAPCATAQAQFIVMRDMPPKRDIRSFFKPSSKSSQDSSQDGRLPMIQLAKLAFTDISTRTPRATRIRNPDASRCACHSNPHGADTTTCRAHHAGAQRLPHLQ